VREFNHTHGMRVVPAHNGTVDLVVFLHLARCGGTTVRQLFHMGGRWTCSFWGLSAPGAVDWLRRVAVVQGKRKIFIEHHRECCDWDLPAKLRAELLREGLKVRLRAFTTLRNPVSQVSSTHLHWYHSVPASVYAEATTELLLFSGPFRGQGTLSIPLGAARAPGSKHAPIRDPTVRKSLINGTAGWCEAPEYIPLCAAFKSWVDEYHPSNFTEIRTDAMAARLAAIRASMTAGWCDAFIAAALARLIASLTHVFIIDEHRTGDTMGDDAFAMLQTWAAEGGSNHTQMDKLMDTTSKHARHANKSNGGHHQIGYALAPSDALPYNGCSLRLYERLQTLEMRSRRWSTASLKSTYDAEPAPNTS
jgi:hypothetical protein